MDTRVKPAYNIHVAGLTLVALGPTLFSFIRLAFKVTRRVLTGEIVQSIDVEIGGGLGLVSLQLKRERRSRSEYAVLIGRASGGVYYNTLEIEELSRFIKAADDIRAFQSSDLSISPHNVRTLGQFTDMILTGEIRRRVDTKIYEGYCTLSLRLKVKTETSHEYVVLGTLAPGMYMYYPFELDEFYRFVAAAKKIRAAAQSDSPLQQQA